MARKSKMLACIPPEFYELYTQFGILAVIQQMERGERRDRLVQTLQPALARGLPGDDYATWELGETGRRYNGEAGKR